MSDAITSMKKPYSNLNRCQRCGATSGLRENSSKVLKSGFKSVSYLCGFCANSKANAYYHKSKANKRKHMEANMRSYAKCFGYQLTKIKK